MVKDLPDGAKYRRLYENLRELIRDEPLCVLEDLRAEIDAELQFRHLCDNVFAEEIFMGEMTESQIREGAF